MTITSSAGAIALATFSQADQLWLARYCAYHSGDHAAAEDLAQETLVEAWRNHHKLRDLDKSKPWLAAIARNICQRWGRARGREAARLADTATTQYEPLDQLDLLPDEIDLERDLERGELIALLDRALALLPNETRDILVAHYIEGLPQSEIAARLGLTENAIAVRLHRGRRALRQLLDNYLRDDIAEYGFVAANADGWSETRMWCPECGRSRLLARFEPAQGDLSIRCATCDNVMDNHLVRHHSSLGLFSDLKVCKPALNRVMDWADGYYRGGLETGVARCMACGRPASVKTSDATTSLDGPRDLHGVRLLCSCQVENTCSIAGLALFTPEGRRFWREHPRIHGLPLREVEVFGRLAMVVSYASLNESAQFDIAFARDTLQILHISGAGS
ncbi:MAG TPA: RNA polymerase sigma factor [Ktedonobacterales bacterium]|nr:RNA polymerase sigma factor [Ktedonobacterales bacterium]